MMTDADNSQSRRRLPSLDELLNGDDDLTEADGLADPHADGEYESQPTSKDFASGPPADAGQYFTPGDFYGYATKDSLKRKRKMSPSRGMLPPLFIVRHSAETPLAPWNEAGLGSQ